jgi:modulator of FtsH protease
MPIVFIRFIPVFSKIFFYYLRFFKLCNLINITLFNARAALTLIYMKEREMKSRYTNLGNSSIRTQSAVVMDSGAQRVLRNTYMLLAMVLGFSAVAAGISTALHLPHPGIVLTMVAYFGLLFLITKYRDRGLAVGLLFALTGFMGYTLGPILNIYLSMAHGTQVVMMALVGTAAIFLSLSAYALVTKRNLSFMGGFLTAGILVAFLAGLGAIIFNIPALSLAVSAVFVLLMSGLILFETNNIVRGGETNYVMATLSLFVALFNLFTSLLQLLGFASSND